MVETIFRVCLWVVIISVILAVLSTLFVTFNLKFEYGNLLQSFLGIITYIFPFKKLMPIFIVVVSLTVFKIGISILKTIWDIFPLSL